MHLNTNNPGFRPGVPVFRYAEFIPQLSGALRATGEPICRKFMFAEVAESGRLRFGGWSFSTRGDLVPPVSLTPSPSCKSATGGGSFCTTSDHFPDATRLPFLPNTTTIAHANNMQYSDNDTTRDDPSLFIQAGWTGEHFYGDVGMV